MAAHRNRAFREAAALEAGAPRAAVSLYRGEVFHARLRPVPHRFRYRVFSILIDLDRLEEADRAARVFSVNRPNLLAFRERDHGPRDGTPLREHARRLLRVHGHAFAVGRILLLAYPRCLGFVFNPLSVYYAFGTEGHLRAVLYEVRNTFGEVHTYVRAFEPGALSPAGLRHGLPKAFHVSPFLGTEARYDVRLMPPAEAVRLHILESDPDGPVLAAGFTGRRRDLTSRTALAALAAIPFMTLKVVAAIHWEALRLWLRNVPIVPRSSKPGTSKSGTSKPGSPEAGLSSPAGRARPAGLRSARAGAARRPGRRSEAAAP